jgi:hypothetical protein
LAKATENKIVRCFYWCAALSTTTTVLATAPTASTNDFNGSGHNEFCSSMLNEITGSASELNPLTIQALAPHCLALY